MSSSVTDAVHVTVQPSRQTAFTEVVCGPPRQDEEEDHTRTRYHGTSQETKDVQFPGVERSQSCL